MIKDNKANQSLREAVDAISDAISAVTDVMVDETNDLALIHRTQLRMLKKDLAALRQRTDRILSQRAGV